MKSFFNNIVRKVFSILLTLESGNTIYASIFKFKIRNKWIFRLLHGTANDEEIFNNILQKFDGKFDVLMIHSSFNDMIPMYTGQPGKLLSLIISFCEQKNITLAMPTFFLGSSYQAKEHYKSGINVFDVRKTVSEMGMFSEMFRRTAKVKRSIHPTHSICSLGPLADKLTCNHHNAETTFGEGTPFEEMLKCRTMILGIGARKFALTQIHSTEDIMKSEFPLSLYSEILPVTCVDEMGNTFVYNLRIKSPEYHFDKRSFKKILKKAKVLEWKYQGIPFFLTQANVVTETLIEAAKKGHTIYKKKK